MVHAKMVHLLCMCGGCDTKGEQHRIETVLSEESRVLIGRAKSRAEPRKANTLEALEELVKNLVRIHFISPQWGCSKKHMLGLKRTNGGLGVARP